MAALRKLLSLSLLANHYPALHGLRVLAVVLVVQVHVSNAYVIHGLLKPIEVGTRVSTFGWVGMDLFFILSGFLIGTILLVSDRAAGGRGQMLRFYMRRSFRIIPLYFVVLTLIYLIRDQYGGSGGILPLTDGHRANLIREYLYLTNYSETRHLTMWWGWSLAVEEHFYLVVPVAMLALRKLPSTRARLWVVGAGFFSALLVRLSIVWSLPNEPGNNLFELLYIPTHTRYDLLIAGIFLAIVQRQCPEFVERFFQSALKRRVLLCIPVVALALMSAPQVLFQLWIGEHAPAATEISDIPFSKLPLYFYCVSLGTLTSCLWLPLAFYLINARGWLVRCLGAGSFLRIATLGYGIYLLHVPCLGWVCMPLTHRLLAAGTPLGAAFPITVGLTLLLSGAVSYLLHLVVERPALALRDRFAP